MHSGCPRRSVASTGGSEVEPHQSHRFSDVLIYVLADHCMEITADLYTPPWPTAR